MEKELTTELNSYATNSQKTERLLYCSYLKITNPYYKNGLETIDAAELEKQGHDGIVSYYFNQAGSVALLSASTDRF